MDSMEFVLAIVGRDSDRAGAILQVRGAGSFHHRRSDSRALVVSAIQIKSSPTRNFVNSRSGVRVD